MRILLADMQPASGTIRARAVISTPVPCPICDTPHCTHHKEETPMPRRPIEPPLSPVTRTPPAPTAAVPITPPGVADVTGFPDGIVAVPDAVDTVYAEKDIYLERVTPSGRRSQILLMSVGTSAPASQIRKYLADYRNPQMETT